MKQENYPSRNHPSWWRRLEFVFRFCLQKTSSRCLVLDQYILLGHVFSRLLQDVFKSSLGSFQRAFKTFFKTSSRRLSKTSSKYLQNVLKTFWRRPRHFEDVQGILKTSCQDAFKCLPNVFKTSCKNAFKASSRRFEDVLKTSSRHIQDVLQRYLQDVFKTYHHVKLFLLTGLWEVFNTFL